MKNIKTPIMPKKKKKTPALDFYLKYVNINGDHEYREMPLNGLCNCVEEWDRDRDPFNDFPHGEGSYYYELREMFRPTDYELKAWNIPRSDPYWASDFDPNIDLHLSYSEKAFLFGPLRQTIVLLLAVMKGEY